MEDLILNVFVIAPIIRWLTSSHRAWNKTCCTRGVYLSLVLLCAVAALECRRSDYNCYEKLGVDSWANPKEIQASSRRLSLQYHPDKNPDPKAREIFNRIREATTIINAEMRRKHYHRFGDFNNFDELSDDDVTHVVLVAVTYYVILFFFGYLYTFGDNSQLSREIFVMSVLGAVGLEIHLRYGLESERTLSWVPWFGRFLPFEQVVALRSIAPLILNGVLMIGPLISVDCEYIESKLIQQILESHLKVLMRLDKFLTILDTKARQMLSCQGLPMPHEIVSEESDCDELLHDGLVSHSPVRPLAIPTMGVDSGDKDRDAEGKEKQEDGSPKNANLLTVDTAENKSKHIFSQMIGASDTFSTHTDLTRHANQEKISGVIYTTDSHKPLLSSSSNSSITCNQTKTSGTSLSSSSSLSSVYKIPPKDGPQKSNSSKIITKARFRSRLWYKPVETLDDQDFFKAAVEKIRMPPSDKTTFSGVSTRIRANNPRWFCVEGKEILLKMSEMGTGTILDMLGISAASLIFFGLTFHNWMSAGY